MKRRFIPMWAKAPSYVLSLAAMIIIGSSAGESALRAGGVWALGGAVALTIVGYALSIAGLTAYWHRRDTEVWVANAFPTDSERDVQMRNDLLNGHKEPKPRKPAWPEEEQDKAMLRGLIKVIKEGERGANR